ncbi:tPR repeat-containing protein [Brachyspira sp. CAG:484]|nr:tPR repeat-containing protein [Brachyspira sp. CAG:484]
MGLNLSNIYQRPYVVKDGRGSVKKKQDDDASKSAVQTEREEQAQNQNSRSRGLQYTENEQKAAPAYQKIQPDQWQNVYAQKAGTGANTTGKTQAVNPAGNFSMRSSKINIAQILKDFKNTQIAIGTPPELGEEVDAYLNLIQKQVQKENPNIGRIKSDLKTASSILDEYISKTLNKESKVVENWVDALFLQQIDFKYNEEEINPQFLVKFPEGSTEKAQKAEEKAPVENVPVQEEVQTEETNTKPQEITSEQKQTNVHIPQDKELKSLFIQSKRLAYANEPRKAIETFQKALSRAEEVGDSETQSKIYYEIGQIYDNHDYPAQALKSYHKSLQNTTDNNIKTKAHYSMAQIYDDVNQIKPALDHYFVSVSYGGESDNLAAQSTSLTRMGNIFSDMYEDNAFEYFDMAKALVSQTDNAKVKGFVASSTGRAYERFGEPQEALKSYSNAVQNYTKADSPLKVAQNYVSAADIMIEYNSKEKARGLLTKAQKFAQKTDDVNLMNEINNRLSQLS